MPQLLLTRIFPLDIAEYIYKFIQTIQCERIYFRKLNYPSLIVQSLIKEYSDYSIPKNVGMASDRLKIITKITYPIKRAGLLEKNIDILFDKYINNLMILKKHLDYHYKNSQEHIRILYGCCAFYLDKLID